MPRNDALLRFRAFHKANPEVYELFKKFAWDAMAAGHRRFSARAIFYRMRWVAAVENRAAKIKVNDLHSRRYAALLMADDPRFAGFFEMRKPRSCPHKKFTRHPRTTAEGDGYCACDTCGAILPEDFQP